MTEDELIRMAHKAGIHIATDVNWMPIIGLEYAERFAKAVLSNIDPSSFMSYQEGYAAGQAAEREACAKVCETFYNHEAKDCAEAIRARGQA